MRRAARTDANHAAIVKYLRNLGASVVDLSAVGGGCPDLLIGYMGANYLAEVKDGSKPPSRQRLNSMQRDWHAAWRGHAVILTCTADVDRLILHQ